MFERQNLNAYLLHSASGKGWKKIGIYPHHGINLPLSALRSQYSSGNGEFYDLIPLIDWCHQLKLDSLQLLPLYHTGKDPSPYNPISSFALHFIYLSLHALPHLEMRPELNKNLQVLQQMNQTELICFEEIYALKLQWLHKYVDAVEKTIVNSEEFKAFVENNPWLKPFALFQVLKEQFGTTSWDTWPSEYQNLSPLQIEGLCIHYASQISFESILQYLCATQLKQIKKYANEKGIFLVGDSPLFIQTQSADVWQFPEYFNKKIAAGAPPDQYNTEGQYWGFPIFEWDVMRENHFDWWKLRLKWLENFFDIFRIDHAIGLFRVWAIPLNEKAKEGAFIPSEEEIWGSLGKELLTMIVSSTKMLCIAEDLGMVPQCVGPVLRELGICSTKVMRWERENEDQNAFIPIHSYPPISLTTVSTHDSEPLCLWWKVYPEEAKGFCSFKHREWTSNLNSELQEEILRDSHHTSSLFHINLLQEYLALFPELVHETPEEERINTPGKILVSNWRYRFLPSVETITSHQMLFTLMQKMIY